VERHLLLAKTQDVILVACQQSTATSVDYYQVLTSSTIDVDYTVPTSAAY